ncbi:carbon-nitrogen hydrolase family protein [Roseovarius sp. MMSF_3281]|uniref:carbon-nitrogen hydrolase family protein n=1 Tax=Roseovarius sp. MMSF_3281 TaxID=3046694 RepID=UPI00273FDBCD|nr:carbon-nitrogen hydrolase family protein [Roseovarius sp. MMSF_3281]
MKAALIQLNSTDDPAENLPATCDYVDQAAKGGAGFILTPEVTNCVSASRTRQKDVLHHEADDPTLAGLRDRARQHRVWLLIGSLALKTDDADGRFANRSFLIDPKGQIAARYDKIHMFDVQVSEAETYRESAGYRPGQAAILAQTDFAPIGMTVCYDIRFPYLYRALAQAGADILTVPSAFSPVTGAAHWEVLLRARAIETGAYVLAPAQTGTHKASRGKSRETYGYSMAVAPWGEVIAEGGTDPGVIYVDLDLGKVAQARQRIPSLQQAPQFHGP